MTTANSSQRASPRERGLSRSTNAIDNLKDNNTILEINQLTKSCAIEDVKSKSRHDTAWKKNWFDASTELDRMDYTKRSMMIRVLMTRLKNSKVHDLMEMMYILRVKSIILLFTLDRLDNSLFPQRDYTWKKFATSDTRHHVGWNQPRATDHDEIITKYITSIKLCNEDNYADARVEFTVADKLFGALRHQNYLSALNLK